MTLWGQVWGSGGGLTSRVAFALRCAAAADLLGGKIPLSPGVPFLVSFAWFFGQSGPRSAHLRAGTHENDSTSGYTLQGQEAYSYPAP